METKSKTELNIAIVGHADSGKSTLQNAIIRAPHLTKLNPDVDLSQYHMDVRSRNLKMSREIGVDTDFSWEFMESQNHKITLINTPGRRDFMTNIIRAISQVIAPVIDKRFQLAYL